MVHAMPEGDTNPATATSIDAQHTPALMALGGRPGEDHIGNPVLVPVLSRPVGSRPSAMARRKVSRWCGWPATASCTRRSSRSVKGSVRRWWAVGCSCVAFAKVIDGAFDDVGAVIRHRSGCGDRGEADVLAGVQCVRDLLVGDDVDVGMESTQPRSSRAGSSKTCSGMGAPPSMPALSRRGLCTASRRCSPACRNVPGSAHAPCRSLPGRRT